MSTWQHLVSGEDFLAGRARHRPMLVDELGPGPLAAGLTGGRNGARLLNVLMVHVLVGWVLMGCVLVGCGSANGPFAISGTVSLDGQPLEQGSISFVSATPGTRGSTGGAISNGKYSIAAEDGRVTISAADMSKATPAGLPANGLAFPSLIDPEFNRAKHEIEVTSEGPNNFAFDVPRNKKKAVLPF